MVALGERECSLQRRHQKIVEESPSPAVSERLRRQLCEAATAIGRAAEYSNAGTVEFLLDSGGRFYFLEVNTRLQVEHPVTEWVMGLDLVAEMLRVAAGERLRLEPDRLRPRGWAIECRIYAEDPAHDFAPSPGRITHLVQPAGPGVRVDSGVEQGDEVSPHYDPLISKLIVHGPNRDSARRRMLAALHEYRLEGVRSVLPFLAALLADAAFARGELHTSLVPDFLARWNQSAGPEPELAALSLAVDQSGRASAPPAASGAGPPAADPWIELGDWTNGAGWT
jgi:acetyl/propionyl-CoA carboxylase alpha subunit